MRFRHAVRAPEDHTQGPEMLKATQNAPLSAHRPLKASTGLHHALVTLAAAFGLHSACAQSAATPADAGTASKAKSEVQNSTMDATLFYQLLISEIQVRQGDLGTAFQLYLDAAKRSRNAQLFQKSVDYALSLIHI